jgi:hypothetical protein
MTEQKEDIKIEIKNEMLRHKIELENKEIDNNYTSCCGSTIDKRVLQFFNRTLIIFLVLLFSMFKLTSINEPNEKSIYINIIMVILGTVVAKSNKNVSKKT